MKKALLITLVFCGLGAMAADLVIQSLSSDGQLVFNEVPNIKTYHIEQRSSLMESWGSPSDISPSGTGSITSSVPLSAPTMFFRVVGEFYPIPDNMVEIPGGTNSGTDDFGPYSLTEETFYMDATEVTYLEWILVYNWAVDNGYTFLGDHAVKAAFHPVHSVNWYDCLKWCNARSEMEGRTPCYTDTEGGSIYKTGERVPIRDLDANGFRLPTNDEWEYAARGGLIGERFPWPGGTISHSDANYQSNISYDDYDTNTIGGYHPTYNVGDFPYTNPVKAFLPNGYGLYGMSGNLSEWCEEPPFDTSYDRVRGGCWGEWARYARCGADYYWGNFAPTKIGFRTVVR